MKPCVAVRSRRDTKSVARMDWAANSHVVGLNHALAAQGLRPLVVPGGPRHRAEGTREHIRPCWGAILVTESMLCLVKRLLGLEKNQRCSRVSPRGGRLLAHSIPRMRGRCLHAWVLLQPSDPGAYMLLPVPGGVDASPVGPTQSMAPVQRTGAVGTSRHLFAVQRVASTNSVSVVTPGVCEVLRARIACNPRPSNSSEEEGPLQPPDSPMVVLSSCKKITKAFLAPVDNKSANGPADPWFALSTFQDQAISPPRAKTL